MELKERLDNLKNQQEGTKELFIKLQGAIELIESMIKEEESPKEDKKK